MSEKNNLYRKEMAQLILTSIILLLLGVNLVPAWQVYQSRLEIKTDNPSGSSLAERYLILGDWPASSNPDFVIKNNHLYNVATRKPKEKKEQ